MDKYPRLNNKTLPPFDPPRLVLLVVSEQEWERKQSLLQGLFRPERVHPHWSDPTERMQFALEQVTISDEAKADITDALMGIEGTISNE